MLNVTNVKKCGAQNTPSLHNHHRSKVFTRPFTESLHGFNPKPK